MSLLIALIGGLVLGGTYALVSMGLTLQYGVARIMNLAYGECVVLACFAAFLLHTRLGIDPIVSLAIVVPGGFAAGWVLYGLMMRPLVRRAAGAGQLEVDSILATFGLLFVLQGAMLLAFGSNYTGYSYLDVGIPLFGARIAANRLLAFGLAIGLGGVFYLLLTRTRRGTALRAVAAAPGSAPLVGIDVDRAARSAFALGAAMAAAGGVLLSMIQTFTAAAGMVITMKALIVVILGGVGNLLGALVAGLLLGVVEVLVATFVDPGLTLAATFTVFLVALLWRPAGLFGARPGR